MERKKKQSQFSKQEAVEVIRYLNEQRDNLNANLPEITHINREKAVQALGKAYHQDDLVLVLGAGISLEVGLPSWDTLLNKLLARTIREEGPLASEFFANVFNAIFRPNSVVLGRYLHQYYEKGNVPFSEIVRRTLYERFTPQTLRKTSPVLQEIVRFCIAPGKAPSLNAIITYNYDDVVEQLLRDSDTDIPFKSIFTLGENADYHELPIFHVHGFLPYGDSPANLPEITFGENIYHKQYNDIYSWNNIVQINKFRDNTCLFIGSSLTDPNIRRLLDIAKAQRGQQARTHFIFKKRYQKDDVAARMKQLLAENKILFDKKMEMMLDLDDATNFMIDIIHAYEENDAQSFGVKVIWVDDFNEIPQLLAKVRKNPN